MSVILVCCRISIPLADKFIMMGISLDHCKIGPGVTVILASCRIPISQAHATCYDGYKFRSL